jgi:hypothetical protein
MKPKRKSYQNGGPITPNYQILDNIKFDSNKARTGEYGQLIVKDENTGKDFGVVRSKDGSYDYWDSHGETTYLNSFNPKNWGVPDHTQSPEYSQAWNLAKANKESEFMWKGTRFNTKDIPQDIKNAIEVARNQVIEDIDAKRNAFKYKPTKYDTINAVLKNKDYNYYNTEPNGKSIISSKTQNSLDSLSKTKYDEVYNRYQEKINNVKNVKPIVTTQKGKLEEDGSWERGKNKMFIAAPDSLRGVNTARHEFHHVTQDYKDTEFLNADIKKIVSAVNNDPSFRLKGYNQADFDYLSNSHEIGARLFNLKTLMKEKNLKTIDQVHSWSLDNRKVRPGTDPLRNWTGYDNSDPNYDVHQLIDLYNGDLPMLDRHIKEYDVPKSRSDYATGGYLENNQMRKKRNYAAGGYAGDPYQLALQQAMQVYPQYAAANNNGVPLANPNPFAPPEQAPNPYNTTNLPLTRQGSMQSVSRQSTPIIPEGLVGDTNNYAGDTTDVMGMAGGIAPLTLNPTNAPANKSFSDGTKEKLDMLGKSGGDPYVLAAEMATKQIGDIAGAFSYKPILGKEKTQSDKNMALAKGLMSEGPIGLGVAALKNYKDKTTVVSGSPGAMPLHDPTFKEKTQRLFRGYAMGGSPGAYWQGGPIGGPGTPRQPYINSSFAGTYESPKRESMRVIPRPLQTPDFGAFARGYVASTEAERMQAIQSGNQAKVNELQNNAFNILDWANTERALGNYQRPTNFAKGGPIKNLYNPSNANNDKDFQDWYTKNTVEGKNNISFSKNLDYDYYSFYKNGESTNYKGGHFPDTYKLPSHETFSDESLYAIPENAGGHWKGENFQKGKGKFGNAYATGGQMGDQQLSDSAFQVKGNPNVTDGNSYPELNANLDHNEVVDKNAKFVFSNQLKNGKETFAKEAAEIYKRIGKVENRKDPISQATVQQLNKQVQNLAMSQEQLAQALGLRNDKPQGMAAGGFAGGPGPDPSTLIQVRTEKSPRTYYDPINHKVFWQDTQGQFVDITGSGKFLTAIERSISGQPGTNPKSYFESDPRNVVTQKPFYSYPVPKNQIITPNPVINSGIPVDNGFNAINTDEFSQTKPQINPIVPGAPNPTRPARAIAQQVTARNIPVSQQDSARTMAGVTMDHERTSGLRDGTGDPRFGNPNLLPGATKEDAIDWYMGNTYPQVKNKYPTAMEQSAAGDFLYNSGKDARVYAYQEYLRKTDPSNTGNWQDAQGNWKDRDAKNLKNLPTPFDQLYATTIGKLPTKQREDFINSGRTWYSKNTHKGDYMWGPTQGTPEVDREGTTVYRAPDGSVSPAYGNTWKGRIAKTSVYPTSTNPNTATTASRTPNSTVSNSKGLPWEGFDVNHFQQWYNSMPGSKIKNDKKWGTETKKAFESSVWDYQRATGKNNMSIDPKPGQSSMLLPGGEQYVDITPVNGKILPSSIGTPQDIPLSTKPKPAPNYTAPDYTTPFKGAPFLAPPNIAAQDNWKGVPYKLPSETYTPFTPTPFPAKAPVVPPTPETEYEQKTTVGDVMQGIDVGSKFFGLAQGPERESQIINNTPITKNVYDINPQLYQNQRNYRNTINSIGTSSAPQRRALSNQMLATKLNSDNGILEQGQNMNNQLNTQYEQLLGARRDRNIASQFQTNNINAANRGEYDNSVQNAFTSLGNFGQALNHQKTSNDVLELLQLNYPNVYKGVMSDWEEIRTGKKKKVVTTTDNTTTTTDNGN